MLTVSKEELWISIRRRLRELRTGEDTPVSLMYLERDIKELGVPLWILGTSKKELRKIRIRFLKKRIQERLNWLRKGTAFSETMVLKLMLKDIKELNLPPSKLGIGKKEMKRYASGRL